MAKGDRCPALRTLDSRPLPGHTGRILTQREHEMTDAMAAVTLVVALGIPAVILLALGLRYEARKG